MLDRFTWPLTGLKELFCCALRHSINPQGKMTSVKNLSAYLGLDASEISQALSAQNNISDTVEIMTVGQPDEGAISTAIITGTVDGKTAAAEVQVLPFDKLFVRSLTVDGQTVDLSTNGCTLVAKDLALETP